MFKRLIEYIKNIISVLSVLIFHVPNKRFDRINGLNNDSYESLSGHIGIVIEEVSINDGKVRYSGAIWKANLDSSSTEKQIPKGEKVKILSARGNTVLISSLNE